MKKIFFIAGEVSGDMYGASIINHLKIMDSGINIYGIGGEKMKESGLSPIFDISKLNFMGFFEVIKNIYTIKKLIDLTLEHIGKIEPDIIFYIDFSGFNQKIAEKVKIKYPKIKNIKFVSPQIWASRYGRIKKITKVFNSLIPILPFEKKIYKDYNPDFDCQYFGNPLKEQLNLKFTKDQFIETFNLENYEKIISIFIGSRKQEILNHSRVIFDLLKRLENRNYIFPMVKSSNLPQDLFKKFENLKNVIIVDSKYQWDFLSYSDFILSKSGTTVLQTVIAQTPSLLFYKTSKLNYFIASKIMTIKYVGLPNIILDKPFIKEFLQEDFTVSNLIDEMDRVFNDRKYLKKFNENIGEVNKLLGDEGVMERISRFLINNLKLKSN
ncbi:MAG: lipid-A-disaccharide synthase [Candidatus Cloacimonadota bacterium]|nr:MAG: lipid-A-disaccharide synthase [Candidatus Cloacimonadota bacterium]PIE78530.1 MAG: lipid-A-disaccharide synthase [Candidatus Delongbacteria bacterium]